MALITPKSLDRWGKRSNRGADILMQRAAKYSWMRWTFLPPESFMDKDYVLRFIGAIAAAAVILQIAAQFLILP